jgi:AsmA protein
MSKKKRILLAAAAVCGVLLLAIVALPFFIDVDHFRPTLESRLKDSLGRDVKIGHLSLSILAGGAKAEDITIADDPDFSNSPFLRANSVDVGLEWWPLISSRAIRIDSLTLQEPQVALLKSSSGKWNFSTLGNKAAAQPRRDSPAASGATASKDVSIQTLKIVNGSVLIGSARGAGKPSSYSDVNLTAHNIAYGTAIPFELTAKTQPSGKLKVEGTAGPLNEKNTAETPLTAHIKVEQLDLASTGFVDPASGLAGVLDYEGDAKSDGHVARTQGKATLAKMRLVKAGTPARQPVKLDYATDYDLARQTGTLSKGDIHVGSSTAHLTGNYETRGDATVLHMKMQGTNLPVQDLEGLLPAFGVVLPAGASLQGGTASANLNLDGPVDRLITSGPIGLSNARIAGFNLGSKMSAIAALAGIKSGSDTMIESLSSQLQVAPEGIKADALNLVVANLGSLTGEGSIGANNQMNFKMLAKFAHSGNTIAGIAQSLGLGNAKDGIPFLIQGTTSNPVFVPDVNALASRSNAPANSSQQTPNPQKGVGDLLQGIFGKKK